VNVFIIIWSSYNEGIGTLKLTGHKKMRLHPKMEAVQFSETVAATYQTAQYHNSENGTDMFTVRTSNVNTGLSVSYI
jgi:hypothetical protein